VPILRPSPAGLFSPLHSLWCRVHTICPGRGAGRHGRALWCQGRIAHAKHGNLIHHDTAGILVADVSLLIVAPYFPWLRNKCEGIWEYKHHTTPHNTTQRRTTPRNAVQHHTTPYNTAQNRQHAIASHHLQQTQTKPHINPASHHLRLNHSFPSCTTCLAPAPALSATSHPPQTSHPPPSTPFPGPGERRQGVRGGGGGLARGRAPQKECQLEGEPRQR
jgi:hypothetical protein